MEKIANHLKKELYLKVLEVYESKISERQLYQTDSVEERREDDLYILYVVVILTAIYFITNEKMPHLQSSAQNQLMKCL